METKEILPCIISQQDSDHIPFVFLDVHGTTNFQVLFEKGGKLISWCNISSPLRLQEVAVVLVLEHRPFYPEWIPRGQ